MQIRKSIDIENAVRLILADYMTAFCRPLPEIYTLPNILVTAVGGSQETDWHGSDQADTFTVNLTSRGETEASGLFRAAFFSECESIHNIPGALIQ